jgi:glycine hydroxymethyltransferase
VVPADPLHGRDDDQLIDYDALRPRPSGAAQADHRRRLAYSRHIDFARFREIADSVGAYLMVDMAHYAGLIAAGVYPSPVPHAHVCTTTTHKTLRGPRGGMILSNDEELGKKFNSRCSPAAGRAADARDRGQGGGVRRGAAARVQALRPGGDRERAALAETLKQGGVDIVSGGTDSHLMLVDLRPMELTGKAAEAALGRAHITCNKNGVPFDPKSPFVTSGVRLGTPAGTTRGFGVAEFQQIGRMIVEVLEGLQRNPDGDAQTEEAVKARAIELCRRFPIYAA